MMRENLIDVIARTSFPSSFLGMLVRGNLSENRQIATSPARRFGGLLAMTAWALLSSPVLAAFEDTGTGARPTALGGAYVAAADDVLSLMYNPAGLAQVRRKEITSEYSKLYAGLSDGSNLYQYFMGYGQPVRWGGTLAFGWRQFGLDDLYKERVLALGYGEWITSRIAVGGTVKQLYHAFGAPSVVVDDAGNIQAGTPSFFAQNGNTSTAYSADLGMLFKWTERNTLGVSIQDFNEPNIALSPSDHEIVSKTLRVGVSHKAKRNLNLLAALTTKESLANQRDSTWTGAAEKWWDFQDGDALAVRGSLASGSREFNQFAMGAGYRFGAVQIDYAFVFNLTGITLGDTAGTHRFSMTYRFGAVGVSTAAPAAQKTSPKAEKARKREIEELVEGAPVSEVDIELPVRVPAPEVKVKSPINRIQLLAEISRMIQNYFDLSRQRAEAGQRLGAFQELWTTLVSYERADVIEGMNLADAIESAARYDKRLAWEGASLQERLAQRADVTEAVLEPVLRKREWKADDRRDQRYQAWLHDAWSYARTLKRLGASADTRLEFLGHLSKRALEFERLSTGQAGMPAEPIVTAPRPVAKPKAAPPVRPARLTPKAGAMDRYEEAMLEYNRRVAAGATVRERLALLRAILDDCQKAGLECRLAYQEFESTFDEEMAATERQEMLTPGR